MLSRTTNASISIAECLTSVKKLLSIAGRCGDVYVKFVDAYHWMYLNTYVKAWGTFAKWPRWAQGQKLCPVSARGWSGYLQWRGLQAPGQTTKSLNFSLLVLTSASFSLLTSLITLEKRKRTGNTPEEMMMMTAGMDGLDGIAMEGTLQTEKADAHGATTTLSLITQGQTPRDCGPHRIHLRPRSSSKDRRASSWTPG